LAWPPQIQHDNHLWSLCLVWSDRFPQNALMLVLCSLAARSRACLKASFTVFSPPGVFYLVGERLACLPPYVVLG
jgi:hypothetical protein